MKIYAAAHQPDGLPIEIDALLRGLPERPSEMVEITALRGNSPDRRYTFRITFPDGSRMKARRFPVGFDCDALRRTLSRLPLDRFAQIRMNNANATLEDWIDGATLDTLPYTKSLLNASGRFLADIHRHASPTIFNCSIPDQYATALEAKLIILRHFGLLDKSLTNHIRQFALRNAPQRWEHGLTHHDFCGANLVLHEGKIVAVDNVTMKFAALDEDLARTWYRWPLDARNWQFFVNGYSEVRDVESYLEHERFWQAITLIHSATVRLRVVGIAAARSPIRRLTELVRRRESPAGQLRRRAA